MLKTITASIMFITLIVTVVMADDKPCKSSLDVERNWKAHQQDESFVCLNNLILADPADPKLHLIKGEYCFS